MSSNGKIPERRQSISVKVLVEIDKQREEYNQKLENFHRKMKEQAVERYRNLIEKGESFDKTVREHFDFETIPDESLSEDTVTEEMETIQRPQDSNCTIF